MKTNLQLTEAQIPQVKDINLKYANKSEEILNSSQGKMQKAKAAKAQEKAKDEELKQVFTEEQFKTYSAKKTELKKKLKGEARKKKKGK